MIARSLALVVAALLLPTPAAATIMQQLDLRQLVARADRVFVGKVVRVTSRWTKDKRRILSDGVIVVERNVHGTRVGQRITVTRLGGTVDGIGMRVSGAAALRKGDRVLLFTEPRGGARFVVGMSQGVYRVYAGANNTILVDRRLAGIELVTRTAKGLRPASPRARRAPLSALIARVKKLKRTRKNKAPRSPPSKDKGPRSVR